MSEAVLLLIALLAAILGLVYRMVRSAARDPKWEFFSSLFQTYGLDEGEEQSGEGPSGAPTRGDH